MIFNHSSELAFFKSPATPIRFYLAIIINTCIIAYSVGLDESLFHKLYQ